MRASWTPLDSLVDKKQSSCQSRAYDRKKKIKNKTKQINIK